MTIESPFNRDAAIGRALIMGRTGGRNSSPEFAEEHIERGGYRANEIEAMLTSQGFVFEKLDGHSLQAPEPRSARLLYTCERR